MSSYQGIATQLYVWSQVLSKQGRTLADSLEDVLAEVAEAGFDGVEGGLEFMADPETRDTFGTLLERHKLRLSALYAGGTFHDRSEASHTVDRILSLAEHAAALGCPTLNVNPDPIGRDKTDEELVIQGEFLDTLGRELRGMGIDLACHHHIPEIRHNAREFRAICAYTTPLFVGVCVDVHWAYRGGEDPLALMREYSDRIRSLHLRNSRNGVWTEAFGDGDIDYRAIHAFLQSIGYHGWLTVELAYEEATSITRPLVENARLSCEYARAVFGVPSTQG